MVRFNLSTFIHVPQNFMKGSIDLIAQFFFLLIHFFFVCFFTKCLESGSYRIYYFVITEGILYTYLSFFVELLKLPDECGPNFGPYETALSQ